MTLRERKKAQTREALAEAALQLFADKGFEHVTVDEIADIAQVSRRTYFRYFPTKEAVVFPDRERRLLQFQEMLASRPADEDPVETVRRALMELARDYEENRARVPSSSASARSNSPLSCRNTGLDSVPLTANSSRIFSSRSSAILICASMSLTWRLSGLKS